MGEDHRKHPQAESFQDVLAVYWRGLDASTTSAEPIFKSLARCNFELMSLASRRMRAYYELPSALGRCCSPQDLLGEQVRFWQGAAQDYANSGRSMADAWSSVLSAGLKASEQAIPGEHDYINFAADPDDRAEAEPRKSATSRRAA